MGGRGITKKQFAVAFVVVAVSGSIGGALSDWVKGRPACAQEGAALAKVVDAARVDRATLYRWARAGRVTLYRVGVRRTYLKRQELEALKKELETPIPLQPDELGKPRNAVADKPKRRRSK